MELLLTPLNSLVVVNSFSLTLLISYKQHTMLVYLYLIVSVLGYPSGECLGDPVECYEYLRIAPKSIEDFLLYSDASETQLVEFIRDDDLCTVDKLYRLHPVWEVRVLAGLQSGIEQARFANAQEQISIILDWCRVTQAMLMDVNEASLISWNQTSSEKVEVLRSIASDPEGLFNVIIDGVGGIVSVIDLRDRRPAVLASFELRKAMEHMRMLVGVKTTLTEVLESMTEEMRVNVKAALPSIRFNKEVYGRHWDVLDKLIKRHNVRSFVEIGVALGAVGLVLLERNSDLNYIGIDPIIKEATLEKFAFIDRATLSVTSSDSFAITYSNNQTDLVFIDGPHTYSNVRNDIEKWIPKLKMGRIISGHDFTPQHPPLVWAVIEQAMLSGVKDINVGMDGVWWWTI